MHVCNRLLCEPQRDATRVCHCVCAMSGAVRGVSMYMSTWAATALAHEYCVRDAAVAWIWLSMGER